MNKTDSKSKTFHWKVKYSVGSLSRFADDDEINYEFEDDFYDTDERDDDVGDVYVGGGDKIVL